MQKKISPRFNIWLIYAVLILFTVFFLLPIYLMLITGLKSFAEVNLQTMWKLPSSIRFDNFIEAINKLMPNLRNSLALTIPAAIISSVLGSLNGYVLSKWKFRGANLIFTLILFGMFIPYQSVLIPLVQFMQRLGLYGGIPGLILVHVIYGIPITTLIFRNYYASVPGEVMAAARIDGADFLSIYRYIMLPLSLPGFVVVIIWQFTNIWNEFLFAQFLSGVQVKPVSRGVWSGFAEAIESFRVLDFDELNANSALALVPALTLAFLIKKYVARGFTLGTTR